MSALEKCALYDKLLKSEEALATLIVATSLRRA